MKTKTGLVLFAVPFVLGAVMGLGLLVSCAPEPLVGSAPLTPEEEVAIACPCDGPWRNHGEYVSCVSEAAQDLRNAGAITGRERGAIVSAAARSDCGRSGTDGGGCGNGVLDTGETCDDGNVASGDGCSADCTEARGTILFKSDRSGSFEVWSMLDDGTNLTQLTSFGTNVHHPRWSRDGMRIAFYEGPWDNAALRVMDGDGSNLQLVIGPGSGLRIDGGNHGTCWSHDGTRLFFGLYSPVTLYEVEVSTGIAAVSPADRRYGEYALDCHPSLPRLVYFYYWGGGRSGDDGIWWDSFAGGSAVRLTPYGRSDWGSRWSSNGARVLFKRNYVTDPIMFVEMDGSGETAIPGIGGRIAWMLDWGADDAEVLYSVYDGARHQLWKVDIDGTGATLLSDGTSGVNEFNPDWHPGGRDGDLDGVLDWYDNCVVDPNPLQADADGDGIGDACDP